MGLDLNKRKFLKKSIWGSLGFLTAFSLGTKLMNAGIWFSDNSHQTTAALPGGGGVSWQAVKTASFTAVAGQGYFVDSSSGIITITLPATPALGDEIFIVDYAGTFATNNITIANNGKNIQGVLNSATLSTNKQSIQLVYSDATQGWLVQNAETTIVNPLYQVISYAALFDGQSGTYMRNSTGTATNNKIMTLSFWARRSKLSSNQQIFRSQSSISFIMWGYSNTDQFRMAFEGGALNGVTTNGLYRDTTAFEHYVIRVDTTQGTASNRIKYWRNGVEETSFNLTNYPGLNTNVNLTEALTDFGRVPGGTEEAHAYFSEVYMVDGQALSASDFGKIDTATGNWIAMPYTGTYGDRGYYLDFSNIANLGEDQSGNGNNWTVYGGVTQLTSTPTNTYATISPLVRTGSTTFAQGNLKITPSNTTPRVAASTFCMSEGKWYWEFVATSVSGQTQVGVCSDLTDEAAQRLYYPGRDGATGVGFTYGLDGAGGCYWAGTGGTPQASYGAVAVGDVCGIALDVDTGKIWVRHNGTWLNSGNPIAGTGMITTLNTGLTWYPAIGGSTPQTCIFNFGQDGTFAGTETAQGNSDSNGNGDFYYAPPTGFKALCTDNLPEITATEKNVDKHFKTVLYTGTAATNAITGVGFQPDFVWIKARDAANHSAVYDACRGVGTATSLATSTTEIVGANDPSAGISSLDSDGFTLTGTYAGINGSGNNYVAWCASLPNTKTSGWTGSPTITPTKEIYNTELGMSIVTYTGNGTSGATIPHSLGVKPGMIIIKSLSNASNWQVYHSSIGATGAIKLNATEAVTTTSSTWNNTEPTATLITVHNGNADTNSSGYTYVAYIFAETDFIKIGSYVGNSSTDGPFINCGVSPVFGFTKIYSGSTNDWCMFDNKRPGYNPADNLRANLTAIEDISQYDIDLTSSGFKLRNSTWGMNNSSGSYIYLVIGQPQSPKENPGR